MNTTILHNQYHIIFPQELKKHNAYPKRCVLTLFITKDFLEVIPCTNLNCLFQCIYLINLE